jgi:hypothetical protein
MWYTQNKEGRNTQEWAAYSVTINYDLKPNVQILLSKVTKNAIILTHLLPPCSRVLLEKLTSSQLVKKFPAFNGT